MARTFSSNNNLVYPSNYNGTAPVTALPITLAIWARLSGTGSQNLMYVNGDAGANHGVSVGYVTAGRVAANSYADPTDATAETTTGITTNTWHHCCGVFASITSRIAYIDGGSSGSNSTSKTVTNFANIAIGSYRTSTGVQWGPAAGQLAEAAIWNVALTASEVAALARGIPPYKIRPDALRGYWPLHGLDSPERDWSPLGTATRYPMTLIGTPPIYAGHAPVAFRTRPFSVPYTAGVAGVIPVFANYYRRMR